MPYTMFDELTVTFDRDTANEIYAYVAAQYLDQNSEMFIWENMDFVKRNFDPSRHHDFLEYLWEAVKNNYAAVDKKKEESKKTVLDILTELFYDKERALKIYNQIQNKYAGVDYDELIRVNIDLAKQKEKKMGLRFLPYLQEVIEKDMASYGAGEQRKRT